MLLFFFIAILSRLYSKVPIVHCRFDAEKKADIKPYSYLPFGAGPRMCIGQRFAILEIKVAIARILQNFTFSRTSESHVRLLTYCLTFLLHITKIQMKLVSMKLLISLYSKAYAFQKGKTCLLPVGLSGLTLSRLGPQGGQR